MLTDSQLDAIRLETIKGSEPFLCNLRTEFPPWIGRLIRTAADARLLLEPIELNLMDDELVEFKDGTKSTRIERIDFLLQCWDDPAKMDHLEEAADLIEYLTEVTMIDLGREWYQPAHDVLVAIGWAVDSRIIEHKEAIRSLTVSDDTGDPISPHEAAPVGLFPG